MGLRSLARSRLGTGGRGVLSIATPTVGGQLLLLVTAPVLARLYGPADFGVFTVVATLATMLGAVAALRFEQAVPLPAREHDAYGLVALGLGAALLTGAAGTVVVAAAGDAVAAAFGQPRLRSWLWAVPPTAAAMGALLVLNQLAIRHRRYGAIGRRNLLQSVSMLLTQLGTGAAGLRPGGLVLGLGIGQVAGTLMLLPGARLGDPGVRRARGWRQLCDTAHRYRRFPLVLAPSGLLNALGLQLPVLLIALWYGDAVAGWLGLAQRVLAAPATLLGAAVAQVYLGEFARAARGDVERARSIFLRASRKLALIAVPAAAVVIVAAPSAFTVLFGAAWANGGAYAQALAVGTAAHFVASPLSQTVVVLGRPGRQFAWDAGRLLLVTGAVLGTALAGAPARYAVWAFGVAAAVAYAVSWLVSLRTVTDAARAAGRERDAEPRRLVRQGEPG